MAEFDGGGSADGEAPDEDGGGGGRDAFVRDASEPACVCPNLPATCAPPALMSPVFTSLNDGATQEQLLDLITCATTSLELASYEITWPCVIDALLAKLARDPDIVINVVIDDDQCPRVAGVLDCDLARLDGQPRVAIVDDARSRYMHHKFVVADSSKVWVSSANFTRNSFCSEDNNSLVVGEPAIVAGYSAEFQRMFTAREFGPVSSRENISGGGVSLYISPESPVTSAPAWFDNIVAAVDTASTSIDFMIFSLTRFEIANAVIAAHRRGVTVRGVVAPLFRSELAVEAMLTAQVPLRIANVHSKTMIVDGRLVITGSPNWSENSWGNNEASLWVASASVAASYTAEADRVWAGAALP